MEDKLLKIRRRLRDDFLFYAPKCLKIRPKRPGALLSFRINKAQAILHKVVEEQLSARGRVRVIILKARQQGLSTYVGGRIYHAVSQSVGTKALVLAHKAESTSSLFDMVKRYFDNTPAAVRPANKYNNGRILTFNLLDSQYQVATAGGDAVARGETLTYLHASEMAFWPKSSARDIWNGLEQAVPNAKGTHIYIESTANGVSGLFYDVWKGAVEGTNGFTAVFIPWFIEDVYNLLEEGEEIEEAPEGFTRTLEEDALATKALSEWGVVINDTQLVWRRRKISLNGSDKFKQEYPATPDEAFLATGLPVFHPEKIARLLDLATDPDKLPRFHMTGPAEDRTWETMYRGPLTEFLPHDNHEQYVIGADVGKGVPGGDWSVAQVLDSQKRHVATLRIHCLPDYFAELLFELAKRYNHARLAVENNDHGALTCYQLRETHKYDNLYMTTQYDKVSDKETVTVGFTTNVKTRPLILDQLRADVRDGVLQPQCKITLREMQTFIINEAGKMIAEDGSHDDCVLALAIADHAHMGIIKPYEAQDDWYAGGDF